MGTAYSDWATVDQSATTGQDRHRTSAPLTANRAWAASRGLVKAGATITALTAIVAMTAFEVPIASGLAVIALIPAMLIDIHEQRIPNQWVVLSATAFTIALSVSAALGHPVSIRDILGGAIAMALPILLLHLLSPAAMGFGDVKAAIVLGAALGAVNWQLALVGLTLAAGIGATVGTLRRSRTIAFGPYLLIGTMIALAANSVLLGAALQGSGQ